MKYEIEIQLVKKKILYAYIYYYVSNIGFELDLGYNLILNSINSF